MGLGPVEASRWVTARHDRRARIATTLINSLQYHDKQFGLETMCVGGGQGMAMILERLS